MWHSQRKTSTKVRNGKVTRKNRTELSNRQTTADEIEATDSNAWVADLLWRFDYPGLYASLGDDYRRLQS